MQVSRFRLAITEIDEPTEVVNRGRVIGVYTPTVSGGLVQGDAVPDLVKKPRKYTVSDTSATVVRDQSTKDDEPGW